MNSVIGLKACGTSFDYVDSLEELCIKYDTVGFIRTDLNVLLHVYL